MMHVWIDGQCLQTASKDRGIGRYVFNLTKALACSPAKPRLSISLNAAMPDELIVARDRLSSITGNVEVHAWQGVAAQGESMEGFTNQRSLSEIALAHQVACIGPDVALSASPFEGIFDRAVPLFSSFGHSIPICAIFYDAIPHRFPNQYLNGSKVRKCYNRRFENLGNHTSALGISAFATSEVRTLFPQLDVYQIDAGLSDEFLPKASTLKAWHRTFPVVSSPYILCVGGLDWRKNVTEVVAAFSLLPLRMNRKLKLVVAGAYPDHSGHELQSQWKSLGLDSENLLMLGRVSDKQLVELYSQAELSIQPSLMEGFGLTALESIQCGTPVIGSNRGALPEVICDPRAMFNPTNPHEIMERIVQLIDDKNIAQTIAQIQHAHVAKFTWSRTADLAMVAMLKTIEKFNLQVDSAELSRIRNLGDLRKITLNTLETKRLLQEGCLVDLMAVAELKVDRTARFYIDVTSTSKTNYTSGIQRVVRKISTALTITNILADGVELVLSFSYGRKNFSRALISIDGVISADKKPENAALKFANGDVVLMLDSSWEHYEVHIHSQQKARIAGAQVISCLYDTVPIKFSAMCYRDTSLIYTKWLESALSISDGFVCISKAVADELLELLKAIRFPRKMKVGYWPLGADIGASANSRRARRTTEGQVSGFLMVGTIEPRKNHLLALEAFAELWKRGFEGTLTIIGRRGWSDEHIVHAIEKNPEFRRKLKWIKNADDGALVDAYRSHDILIAASHAEGFGLPIVEAMQHGCQILASDIQVFREVAGNSDMVQYFEPNSKESLKEKILTATVTALSSQADLPPSWVSWEQSAAKLADVVINDNWYAEYIPSDACNNPPELIGQTHITKKLLLDETKHRLEIIGPAVFSRFSKTLKLTVKVTNDSQELFSSRGNSEGELGIYLGYHIADKDGGELRRENPRSAIPFVIPPGDSVYLPVEVDLYSLPSQAAFIDLEMVQAGGRWWGNPLRVPLKV